MNGRRESFPAFRGEIPVDEVADRENTVGTPRSRKMTTEPKKYAFIDALRGYAIILVVLIHCRQAVPPENKTLLSFMEFGARGVQLFFIASAITLCMSWHTRNANESSPIRNFFIRRIFRIVPMFWLAAAFYLALYGLEPRSWAPYALAWYSIPLTALFLNGYSPDYINAIVPGGWSVVVEVSFYLVFPLLLARIRNFQGSVAVVFLAIGVSVLVNRSLSVLFVHELTSERSTAIRNFLFWNFFTQLPVFALGIATYFVVSSDRLNRIFATASSIVLAAAFCIAAYFRSQAIDYLFDHLLLTSVMFASIAVNLYNFPKKLVVHKSIQYIGKLSFSLYLVHFAVLFYLERFGVKSHFETGNISSLSYFVLVFLIGTAIAAVSHEYIERPGIRLGSRIIGRLEARGERFRLHGPVSRVDA